MQSFDELVDEKLTPVLDSLYGLGAVRRPSDYTQALPPLEAAVTAAEAFVARTSHVETSLAKQFRGSVQSARYILDYHQGQRRTLASVGSAVQVVPSAPRKPEPPANAIVLSRAAAGDVRNYERAKARAAAEHRPLWIE